MLNLPKCPSITFRTPPKSTRIDEELSHGAMWSVAARRGRRRINREDMFAVLPFVQELADHPSITIFAVFDGHGGQRAAQLASNRLPHLFLKSYRRSQTVHSALRHAFLATDAEVISELSAAPSKPDALSRCPSGTLYAATALQRAPSRSDSQVSDKSSTAATSEEPPVPRALPDVALTSNRYKNESYSFSNPVKLSAGCGTTATVVTLIGDTLSVAHVGDSRAVLGRANGEVIRLCEDHRPGREDEQERIVSAGGLVVCVSGTCRVNGVLAVSRAIGDVDLKKYVIAEPDIASMNLQGDEEYMILGSDGLWDVVSDEESVQLVRDAVNARGCAASEEHLSKMLVQEAWDRGSNDDVSVIVVDLKKYLELDCGRSMPGDDGHAAEEEVIGEIDLDKLTLLSSDSQEVAIEMVTPLSAVAETPRVGRFSAW